MNFEEIKERLQQVLQIVEESGRSGQLSDLERDLVLNHLRDCYSALRFVVAEQPKAVEQPVVVEEPKVAEDPKVEVVEAVEEPQVVEEPIVVEKVLQPVEVAVEVVEEVEPIAEPAPEPVAEPAPEPQPVVEVVEEKVEVVKDVVEEPALQSQPQPAVDSEVAELKTRKSAMYSLYEESVSEPTLGDSFSEKSVVADTISAPKGVAESQQIDSLVSAIGVADRFMLIRELFDGDAEAYQRAITALDAMGSFDDCVVYIAENFSWRPNSDATKFMMELLQRKYKA